MAWWVMRSLFQAEDGIRGWSVTGVQTCALPISARRQGRYRGADRGQIGPAHPAGAIANGGYQREAAQAREAAREIGRASCRERVEESGEGVEKNKQGRGKSRSQGGS